MNTAIASYSKLNERLPLDGASPHTLIDALLGGAHSRLLQARDCIEQDDIEGRSKAIGATVAILVGLQESLDHERGGDLAVNLDALYDYMQRRLIQANADNDAAAVGEVLGLVAILQEAWSAIGDQVPQRAQAVSGVRQ